MWVDDRFVFYCLGLVCGFVLFECFRAFEVWRMRRLALKDRQKALLEMFGFDRDTVAVASHGNNGYKKAVEAYGRLPRNRR